MHVVHFFYQCIIYLFYCNFCFYYNYIYIRKDAAFYLKITDIISTTDSTAISNDITVAGD